MEYFGLGDPYFGDLLLVDLLNLQVLYDKLIQDLRPLPIQRQPQFLLNLGVKGLAHFPIVQKDANQLIEEAQILRVVFNCCLANPHFVEEGEVLSELLILLRLLEFLISVGLFHSGNVLFYRLQRVYEELGEGENELKLGVVVLDLGGL